MIDLISGVRHTSKFWLDYSTYRRHSGNSKFRNKIIVPVFKLKPVDILRVQIPSQATVMAHVL